MGSDNDAAVRSKAVNRILQIRNDESLKAKVDKYQHELKRKKNVLYVIYKASSNESYQFLKSLS